MEKKIVRSIDTLPMRVAECLGINSAFSQDDPSDASKTIWYFEDRSFKTAELLIGAGEDIVDGIENAYFFADMKAVWNPKSKYPYRRGRGDSISNFSDPNACVRLVIKDETGKLHDIEITAFGTLKLSCDFEPYPFKRE